MNTSNQIDRRITKSKQALKDALLTMMQVRDFKKISITDIVQTANLNRGTFYKHYEYKEDILEEIIDDVTTDLITSYRDPYFGHEQFDVKKLTSSAIKIFDHVAKYEEFYTLIVNSNSLSGFQDKICNILKDLMLNDLRNEFPDLHIDRKILASFYSYAILGMIIEWVNIEFRYSANFMAEQLLKIINTRNVGALHEIETHVDR